MHVYLHVCAILGNCPYKLLLYVYNKENMQLQGICCILLWVIVKGSSYLSQCSFLHCLQPPVWFVIQWNLSITDTLRTICGLERCPYFSGCLATLLYVARTTGSVLIREMSLIRSSLIIDGLHCTLGNSHAGCRPVTIFCEAMKPYRPTLPHIYIIM